MKSLSLITACFAALGISASAHHDPATEAALVTAQIQSEGASIELLCRRAELWRSLRKMDATIGDYAAAVKLDPKSPDLRLKLAKAYFVHNQLKEAFAQVGKGLECVTPEDASLKASLLMMRAQLYLEWKSPKKAAADCEAAMEASPDHRRIDWFLQCAHAQRLAGRFEPCAKGLRKGFEQTGSGVLYAHWVDALIDTKAYSKALQECDEQLHGLRFSASWRIKRARALAGLKREKESVADLQAALKELDSRLHPDDPYPDLTLLLDRGMTHFLLGNRSAAKKDYERAKSGGAVGWMCWQLTQAFGS